MKMTIGARTLAFAAALAAMPAAAQTVTPQENDRTVHAFLSAVDLGEVQTSTLAQERAANAEVKAFAASMVAEHGAALHAREAHVAEEGEGLFEGQMSHAPAAGPAGGDAHAGHGAGAAPAFSAAQLQAMQAALEQHPASRSLATAGGRNFQVLQGVTGPQFDATYMDAQIAAHRYALGALDRMIAQGGVTGEMLAMMNSTRAAVARHLEQAQLIRGRLQ